MRTRVGLLIASFCACSYLLILFLASSRATAALDAFVLLEINGTSASEFVAFFAAFITQFGSDLMLAIIALLVFVLSKSNRNVALRLVAVVVLSDALVFVLRTAYVRPRPYETIASLILPVGRVSDPSFPSGHATRIFGFATALVATKGREYAAAIVLAAAVATSRVTLGVHFPLDVVAGAFLGIGLGIITVAADERLGVSRRILHVVGSGL